MKISMRAPTSTPRVGSSASRTTGWAAIERARSTFCWLPPERVSTMTSDDGVRTSKPSIWPPRSLLLLPSLEKPRLGDLPKDHERQVLPHRHGAEHTLRVAVPRQVQSLNGANGTACGCPPWTLAPLPSRDEAEAAERPQDLPLPVALHPGQPHNLTGCDVEGDTRQARASQVGRAQ